MEGYLEVSVGGVDLRLSHIDLLPEDRVSEWKRLTLLAEQKMGPLSSGIGLVGSIGWVAAGSLILGALEHAATSSAQREGLEALAKAKAIFDDFARQRRAVPVGDIQGLSSPNPHEWRGEVREEVEIDTRTLTRAEAAALYAAQQERGGPRPMKTISTTCVVATTDFIGATCRDRGPIRIRWSSVSLYRLV